MSTKTLDITIQFGGGAELLVGGVKQHQVNLLVDDKSWSVQRLLGWIKDNLLKERPELFLQDDTVRPGILVLINDADWELLVLVSEPDSSPLSELDQNFIAQDYRRYNRPNAIQRIVKISTNNVTLSV